MRCEIWTLVQGRAEECGAEKPNNSTIRSEMIRNDVSQVEPSVDWAQEL